MTVKDLIATLQTLPEDAKVFIPVYEERHKRFVAIDKARTTQVTTEQGGGYPHIVRLTTNQKDGSDTVVLLTR